MSRAPLGKGGRRGSGRRSRPAPGQALVLSGRGACARGFATCLARAVTWSCVAVSGRRRPCGERRWPRLGRAVGVRSRRRAAAPVPLSLCGVCWGARWDRVLFLPVSLGLWCGGEWQLVGNSKSDARGASRPTPCGRCLWFQVR
jgi:hypothetical protein